MASTAYIGPYQLHRRIARGGMADIFLGSRPGPDGGLDLVAVKSIRPELADDESFVRMFLDEARITQGLSHPNITQLLDFGMDGSCPYLVMEFVAGVSLKSVLKARPMPEEIATTVAACVAEALHAAHEKKDEAGQSLGIVHRDVTPHNVMITFDGRVKLLDFGIALARVRAERTRTGILKGKWSYMSPEQVLGRPLDRRSDIFSLGSLMYEMLTGTRAFDGESPSDVLRGVLMQDPPALVLIRPDLRPGFAGVVSKCLAKEVERRFHTAHDVALRLAAVNDSAATGKPSKALADYVLDMFPERFAQIEATRSEIYSSSEGGFVEETLDQPTLVQPAPFEELAGDLEGGADAGKQEEGIDIEFEQAPALLAPPVAPPALQPDPIQTHVTDADEEPEAQGVGSFRVATVILVGLALGLGCVVALWYLGYFDFLGWSF